MGSNWGSGRYCTMELSTHAALLEGSHGDCVSSVEFSPTAILVHMHVQYTLVSQAKLCTAYNSFFFESTSREEDQLYISTVNYTFCINFSCSQYGCIQYVIV